MKYVVDWGCLKTAAFYSELKWTVVKNFVLSTSFLPKA